MFKIFIFFTRIVKILNNNVTSNYVVQNKFLSVVKYLIKSFCHQMVQQSL